MAATCVGRLFDASWGLYFSISPVVSVVVCLGLDREGSSSWGAGGDSGCGGSQGLDVAIRAYKPGADGAAGEEAGRKLDGTWREVELSPRLLAKGRGGSASAGPPSPAGGRSPGRGCALEDGIRSLTAFGEHQVGGGTMCPKA